MNKSFVKTFECLKSQCIFHKKILIKKRIFPKDVLIAKHWIFCPQKMIINFILYVFKLLDLLENTKK